MPRDELPGASVHGAFACMHLTYLASRISHKQISGLNKTGPKYKHPEYNTGGPIIPHGISVALTGPAGKQAFSHNINAQN
jgi:hypothetical protein